MLKTRNPTAIAPPAAKYSHSVEVAPNARWLFTAGQVGVRPDGSIPEGFEAQHDQIWQTRSPFLRTPGWAQRISSASTCIPRIRTD
jgi:2-iminobutanoate/2-iminopropanoate deaminase